MGEKETLSAGERSQAGGGATAIGEEGVQGTAGQGEAIAIDEEGVQRATNLNTSRSNRYVQDNSPNAEIERLAGEAPRPMEASNLNQSKSNIDRLGGGEPDPQAATTVKSSKSNSSERLDDPGPGEPGGATEASNLNLSKSNINRAAGAAEGLAVDEPGVIDK